MSDSDKTNELDNYGVWVKKPPRTVSSEIGEENTGAAPDTNNDLPDFENIDVVDNSAAIADDAGETEISLDEFIDGGVFEGDDAPAAPASAPAAESGGTESVSVDDFMESSDITISDPSETVSEAAAIPDDGPIDIDLSFDDSDSPAPVTSGASSSAGVAAVPGSEEVDLSDFGVDFGDGDSSSSSSESSVSNDGTESVDLSDFGVDFSDDGASSAAAESAPTSSEPVVNEDGTEEISLDSFGFDINAEEPSAGNEAPAAQESSPAEEETVPSLAEESPSPSEPEDSFTVVADDDVGDISLDAEPSSSSSTEATSPSSQDFSAPDDDDFDLDSIMDSIEDENGNTSSLNESSEPASAAEETVIEEPVVNDVVDSDEPVFEETSVDIPETAADEENPFTLPPDDAFTATITEEPTIHEENNIAEDVSLDGLENPVLSEEPNMEQTETIEKSSNIIEESITEPVVSEVPAFEEQNSKSFSAPETAPAPQESVKQDSEISAATNSILSQIASELSSLRNEISNLKNDFEELKNKENTAQTTAAVAEPAFEEPSAETQTDDSSESSGGFFGNSDDEDETIALSLDEMDNILNSVEIVEEQTPDQREETESAAEEPAFEEPVAEENSESLDFSNENIEEPVLDDIDTNIAEDELPEEILVPKSDDILVESSQENLIEEEAPASITEEEESALAEEESTELAAETPVSGADEAFNFENSGESTKLVDEPFVFDDSELSSPESASEGEPYDSSADDTTLSADELANIAADSSTPDEFEAEMPVEETEENEPGESSIPSVADILGDTTEEQGEEESGVSISEGELDTLLSSEAAKPHIEEEEEEKSEPVQSSIPNNLQKEIKSVLSYMDQLLENLPEEKIAEFAQSEQFETYKKLFKELGLD